MATDARLAVGLASHPKTKKLIRRVGGDGAWRLVCLFLWCAANRPDGSLEGLSDEDIELAVDWPGAEGQFVAALRDVGFLDGDEMNSEIHDWAEHNPWVSDSEARSEKARWAALCKRYGRPGAAQRMPEYAKRIGVASNEDAKECQEHAASAQVALLGPASSMQVAESSSAPSPSPSPSPSPNTKDKTTSSASPDLPAGFVEFWGEWPGTARKTGKAECLKRWRSRKLEADAQSIVAHVRAMKGSRQWQDGFEPAPLTYLNQRRWEDGVPLDAGLLARDGGAPPWEGAV